MILFILVPIGVKSRYKGVRVEFKLKNSKTLNSSYSIESDWIQTGMGTLDAPESIALSHYRNQINLSLMTILSSSDHTTRLNH